ncbi:MAG: inositol monophosphatase family protein [Mycobacteriales bacterium]
MTDQPDDLPPDGPALDGLLLDLAVDLARRAGDHVRALREAGVRVAATKSSPTDVVTAADQASEHLIVSGLLAARPDDGVLGEEGGERPGGSGIRWLVDPIDGTVNYLYGLPQYAVSIAAERDGQAVVGVVYNPASGEMFTARRGQGARWHRPGGDPDGVPIRCSALTRLDRALVATGFGYAPERRAAQAEVVRHLLPEVRDIRRFGSAALDLCFAAMGRFDAYFEQGAQAWDLGAGGLVATEAGMVVSGLRGRPAGPDLAVAAPPALHGPLCARLAELDADNTG